MDSFCEYLVKRKKSQSDKIIIAAIIAFAILFTFAALLFLFPIISRISQPIGMLVLPAVIVMWYVVIAFTKMYSIEYEYAITDGEFDIDKIVNKSKRTSVLTKRLRTFEIIAPVNSLKYTSEFKNLNTTDCSANRGISATYFAVYSDDSNRKCILFDPSNKMLDIIEKYCPDKFFRA